MQGQEEYYITALDSGLEFLLNLKAEDLKLSQHELANFENCLNGQPLVEEEVDLLGVGESPVIG